MIKFHKILFFFTLILGSLIAISSYSWLSMWMGLEINLLSIIPLLKDENNIFPSESALKYFITQALASSILLFSILLSLNFKETFVSNLFPLNLILISSLLTKLGAAPFHAWFPEVMDGLNWLNGMIMLTWQKIAPMVLLFYTSKIPMFFIIIILISSIIGGVSGLNQISFRKLLAYSSINHISWMLSSMLNFQSIWSFYFLIYSIISINIILIFHKLKIWYLNQLTNSLNWSKLTKFFFILNFLSLGGLPPFLGFFPKWLVINNLVENHFFFLSLLLIIFTLITLFFYLRIIFSTLMINLNESLIFKAKDSPYWIFLFNSFSLFGLLVCTLVMSYS